MEVIERFSVAQLPEEDVTSEYRRRLLFDGKPTAVVIDGEDIAAQFACGEFFLLLASYDYFDGVCTWVYLLDKKNRVVDQADLPDHTGFLHEVTIVDPRTIAFGFYDTSDRWSVTVDPAGFRSFRMNDIARRLNRFLLRKRRLRFHHSNFRSGLGTAA